MISLLPVTIGRTTLFGAPVPECTRPMRRSAERAAVAGLVGRVFGDDAVLSHMPSGAPFVDGRKEYVSVSHGAGVALLAVNEHAPVGVDIECWREQLARVAVRFLSEAEMAVYGTEPERLLWAWTVKEAVYKAAGMERLDLSDIRLPLPAGGGIAEVVAGGVSVMRFRLFTIGDFPVLATVAERILA